MYTFSFSFSYFIKRYQAKIFCTFCSLLEVTLFRFIELVLKVRPVAHTYDPFQLRQEDHKFQASLGKTKLVYYIHLSLYANAMLNSTFTLNRHILLQARWTCSFFFYFFLGENLSIAYKQAYLYTSHKCLWEENLTGSKQLVDRPKETPAHLVLWPCWVIS